MLAGVHIPVSAFLCLRTGVQHFEPAALVSPMKARLDPHVCNPDHTTPVMISGSPNVHGKRRMKPLDTDASAAKRITEP